MTWLQSTVEKNQTISAEVVADIEARDRTRVLLNHQFELIFGFRPDDAFSPAEQRERMEGTIRQYTIESIAQLETFVNHLCLTPTGFASVRLLSIYRSNISAFGLLLDSLRRARESGELLDPQYDELLAIIEANAQ